MARTKPLIEKLTDNQVAQLAVYRERWLKIGLSTEPADRPAAEAAVREAYAAAGMDPPRLVIWLQSPLAGCIGAAMLAGAGPLEKMIGAQVRAQVWAQVWSQVGALTWARVRAQVWSQVGAQVWSQVGAQVWDQVGDQVGAQVGDQVRDQVRARVWAQTWAQVRAQVGSQVGAQVGAQVRARVRAQTWDQVGDQVGAQVWAQVGDQVWAQVGDQVWAQVGDQVRDQVRDQVGDQVNRAGYGQHDASWLGFYTFFSEVCKINSADRLKGLSALAQAAGWWWPFKGAVILTERPVWLARDEQNRLHCENRAAIEYADGWGVYAWHGLRVPARLILEPKTITVAEIEAARNAEVRRVMVTRYGADRYLRDSGARLVHADSYGELYSKLQPGDEPLTMVKVINSTPEPDGSRKEYWLRVHPELRPLYADGSLGAPQGLTAHAAVASTFGLRAEDYAPAIET